MSEMKFPTFDGSTGNYHRYITTFTETVDKDSYSEVYKFQLLTNSLKGEALKAIGNLAVVGNNYKRALIRLEERLGDKIEAFKDLIQRLTNHPNVSLGNLRELRKLCVMLCSFYSELTSRTRV